MKSTAPRRRPQLTTLALLSFGLWLSACLPPLALRAVADEGIAPGALAQIDSGDEATCTLDSAIGPVEYRAGRGLSLGRTGLNVGGFSTLEVEVPKGENDGLGLDSVNFLVLFEPNDLLSGFMELEVGDLFFVDFDSGKVHSDPSAVFERLHGDFTLRDAFNLRAGKFQTPVGRWNLVPAEPFVWTANEPSILTAFPETQTGGAVYGRGYPGQGVLEYWLYGQFIDGFDIDPDEIEGSRSVGGRLEYARSRYGWSLGGSYLGTSVNGRWNHLGGLDAQLRRGPFEFTTEFVYQDGKLEEGQLWDIYLQGVVEVLPRFNLVARYEHYSPLGSEPSVEIGDFGVAWLPRPYLIFKATYRIADREPPEDPEGFKAAFSVVF